MKRHAWIYANPPVTETSLQEARDRRMFGPVYHGTYSVEKIHSEGFRVFVGDARSGDVSHGYEISDYYGGIPAPVHHLGYGIYFSTVKDISKQFGVIRDVYYLDVPRLLTINFAVPRTMMQWWTSHGYDPYLAKTDRVAATLRMTEYLKSEYDAIWFKGKGMRRLLDGDQICVYDPNRIYKINSELSHSGEIGAKVRRKIDGMLGTILKQRENLREILEKYPGASIWAAPAMQRGATYRLAVKWRRGGTDLNVTDDEIDYL